MSNTKSQYLLLFRGSTWYRELSVNELQEIMGRTNVWIDQMISSGVYKAGQPLEEQGRVISARSGSVSDGPFNEAKESVGGYVLIEADNLDHAVEIARGNPMIPHGLTVEIRPVTDDCPANKLALQQANAAAALA